MRISDTTHHNAFTDLCCWQGRYYCAYRVAPSHNICPPGRIVIQHLVPRCDDGSVHDYADWSRDEGVAHPTGDMRDPKFIVTPDVLYLMCGIYLPHPAYNHCSTQLMASPADNILQTHMTYTTNGTTWSALVPILRPNYWGWSGVVMEGPYWAVASYHVGGLGDFAQIALWSGENAFDLKLADFIYSGGSTEREGHAYRYRASQPSEPVLWYDETAQFYGCLVRTETSMLYGVGRQLNNAPSWRWTDTKAMLHPSAVLPYGSGTLVAARDTGVSRASPPKKRLETPKTTTALYLLEGSRLTRLLTLPSSGDTGYAGICRNADEGEIMMSYYSQDEVPHGLPSSAVYVATIGIE